MVVLVLEMCRPIGDLYFSGLIFLSGKIVWERELLFLSGTGASLDWQF